MSLWATVLPKYRETVVSSLQVIVRITLIKASNRVPPKYKCSVNVHHYYYSETKIHTKLTSQHLPSSPFCLPSEIQSLSPWLQALCGADDCWRSKWVVRIIETSRIELNLQEKKEGWSNLWVIGFRGKNKEVFGIRRL